MKKILLFLILIFIIPSINASLDVEDEPIKNILLPEEEAIFDITVENNQDKRDDITYIIYDDWDWEKLYLDMPAHSSETFQLKITPPTDIESGEYSLGFRVYSQTDSSIDVYHQLIVEVVDYEELVNAELQINPQGLDPRKENLVKVKVKNNKNIKLDEVKISLSSDVFSHEFIIGLLPLELRIEEFTTSPNSQLKEGDYNLNVLVSMNNNTLIERTDIIKVAYYSDIQESKETDSSFLVSKINLVRTNKGNSLSEELYTVRLSNLEKIFTRFDPEPSKVDKVDGYYYYTWKFDLEPGSVYNINVETNFRTPLISLIVIILLLIIIYNLVSSQVSLKKKVLTLKTSEGISEMKVLIILNNKGRKVKRVRVIDYLPNIVKAPTEYITIKPSKIKTSNKGLMLIWDIHELVKGEERIISYKIKSKVQIIGRLSIPRALCRYKKRRGKFVMAKSNRITLFSS